MKTARKMPAIRGRCIVPIALLILSAHGVYADDDSVYTNRGPAVVRQEKGSAFYVYRDDGRTDVLFKQDDGLVYDDKGHAALVQEEGDGLGRYPEDPGDTE